TQVKHLDHRPPEALPGDAEGCPPDGHRGGHPAVRVGHREPDRPGTPADLSRGRLKADQLHAVPLRGAGPGGEPRPPAARHPPPVDIPSSASGTVQRTFPAGETPTTSVVVRTTPTGPCGRAWTTASPKRCRTTPWRSTSRAPTPCSGRRPVRTRNRPATSQSR